MKFKLKEIKTIETIEYEGLVCDLTVKDDESYNINNIIVHNSRCSTRNMTGVGIPMITSILNCVAEAETHNIPIMADGGIGTSGDIAKALGAGASTVMVGNMIAGCDECPPSIQIDNNGMYIKQYSGSASMSNKVSRGEKAVHIEGVSKNVPYKGSVELVINRIIDGLKSSCSYVGAHNIDEFHRNVEFVRVTNAGIIEAGTHH